MRGFAGLLAVVLAGCSAATGSSTTGPVSVACEDPPSSEIDAASRLDMSVEPNPAIARETVRLSVSSSGLPEGVVAGVDAAWQCWSGSHWATTHIVYRGFGENAGQTIPVNDAFQIRVPSIGLALDEGYPIVIPPVESGLYRIADDIFTNDGRVPGFVIVEVVQG